MGTEIIRYGRIRDLREDRDLPQKYVAAYLQIRQNTYSRYESNERGIPPEVFSKLADLYGTSVDYLMNRTDEPAPYPKTAKRMLASRQGAYPYGE